MGPSFGLWVHFFSARTDRLDFKKYCFLLQNDITSLGANSTQMMQPCHCCVLDQDQNFQLWQKKFHRSLILRKESENVGLVVLSLPELKLPLLLVGVDQVVAPGRVPHDLDPQDAVARPLRVK